MATQSVSISAPVGTRNGITPLPNQGAEVATITDLFDRIASQDGGTSDVPGVWPTGRVSLIGQVTAQIQTFQSVVAAAESLPGMARLVPTSQQIEYSRRLVSVSGSSIKWFGVLLPTSVGASVVSAAPHIFFTPMPAQGGYSDANYEAFTEWGQLWDDDTDRIGGLLSASGANQVLVIRSTRPRKHMTSACS